MPKLACTCGYVHNLTPQPGDGFTAIPDAVIDQLQFEESEVIRERRCLAASRQLYECPNCGRLALQTAPGTSRFTFYAAERHEPAGNRAIPRMRELDSEPLPVATETPAFELWLEFEQWVPMPHHDVADDTFNMLITLRDGTRYALNVWTYAAFETLRREAADEGDELAGRYLMAPDLFVERLDRELLEAAVAHMVAAGTLKQEWIVGPDVNAG